MTQTRASKVLVAIAALWPLLVVAGALICQSFGYQLTDPIFDRLVAAAFLETPVLFVFVVERSPSGWPLAGRFCVAAAITLAFVVVQMMVAGCIFILGSLEHAPA